jgi:hypothetical protein
MSFEAARSVRSGTIRVRASKQEVFPLLCPKREEDWIPGWECETIWSESGYNEEGAVFRTTKPYDTELYWATVRYDIDNGIVDFLISAPRLFVLRFTIAVEDSGVLLTLTFTQVFTSISEEGKSFLERYSEEDYEGRLKSLEEYMIRYLDGPGR